MGPEDEFEEYDSKGSWITVFQKIRQEASMKHDYSLKDAKKPEFRSRNRYRDVSPYDHSRVRLERNSIDYINASFVRADTAHRSYILTQGPLPDTSAHFWLMVWEQDCRAVLMLNRVIEKGQVKCHQYYPMGNANEGEDQTRFEEVDLAVRYVTEVDKSYYTVRTLELTDHTSGQTKEVLQFHYTTWPDFGVPESPKAFLDFLFDVRQSGALDANVGPPVIHCSAGIGRSGTFCLVDTCLVLAEKQGSLSHIDVCSVLMGMRKYRMGLIQTPDQLRFSYLAIIEGARQTLLSSQDSGFSQHHKLQTPDCDEDGSVCLPLNNNLNEMDTDSDDSLPSTPPPVPPRLGRCLGQPAGGVDSEPPGGRSQENSEVIVRPGRDDVDTQRTNSVEIRRRAREDRLKSTTEKIAQMKRRQEESERWQARKRSMKPYLLRLGVGLAVLIGGYLLYKHHFTS